MNNSFCFFKFVVSLYMLVNPRIAKELPHVSIRMSIILQLLPSTNNWWISSLVAYSTQNIIARIMYFVVSFSLVCKYKIKINPRIKFCKVGRLSYNKGFIFNNLLSFFFTDIFFFNANYSIYNRTSYFVRT